MVVFAVRDREIAIALIKGSRTLSSHRNGTEAASRKYAARIIKQGFRKDGYYRPRIETVISPSTREVVVGSCMFWVKTKQRRVARERRVYKRDVTCYCGAFNGDNKAFWYVFMSFLATRMGGAGRDPRAPSELQIDETFLFFFDVFLEYMGLEAGSVACKPWALPYDMADEA